MAGEEKQGGKHSWRDSLGVVLPLVAFLLVLMVAAGLYLRQQAEARRGRAELAKANEALGLPSDYPADEFPLFPEAKLVKAERSDAVSDKGQPMDEWDIKAQSQASVDDVYHFYLDIARKRGMTQSTMFSAGGGYSVTYADAQTELQFIIERLPSSQVTDIQLTVYRLRR